MNLNLNTHFNVDSTLYYEAGQYVKCFFMTACTIATKKLN